MNQLRLLCLSLGLALTARAATSVQWSNPPVIEDTESAACEVLKQAVVKQRHLPADAPTKWRWFCDFSDASDDHVRIVALRAGRCDAYSCLMGWFAVMRRSSVVLGYDGAEDRIVPLDVYPAHK